MGMVENSSNENRDLLHQTVEARTIDVFGLVLSNLIIEVENFKKMIENQSMEGLEDLLSRLTERNDSYIELINNIINESIFLPFKETSLYNMARGLSSLIDSIEAFGHRIDLYPIEEWIRSHLDEMLNFLHSILSEVFTWIEDSKTPNLKMVQELENKADDSQRAFMKQIYHKEIDFKQFMLAKDLNSILEQSIDKAEKFSEDLHLFLKTLKLSDQDPPTYLS
ncbi:MAG: DUF47 family protein [Methanobacteriota archaeon]|nr:MAG: DUF47 family protein [Euryarchaeota archaeon]